MVSLCEVPPIHSSLLHLIGSAGSNAMTEQHKRVCLGIVASLQRNHNAGPFLLPFKPAEWAPGAPPTAPVTSDGETSTPPPTARGFLDLQSIQERLEQNRYKTTNSFMGDLQLLFQHARLAFGHEHTVHCMATTLEKYLFALLTKLPKKQKQMLGIPLSLAPVAATSAVSPVTPSDESFPALDYGDLAVPRKRPQDICTDNLSESTSVYAADKDTAPDTPQSLTPEQEDIFPSSCPPAAVAATPQCQPASQKVPVAAAVAVPPPATQETPVSQPPSARPSARVCAYCGAKSTPMWRHGPPKFDPLCNSCGVKWRRGRILQEFKRSTQVNPLKRRISQSTAAGSTKSSKQAKILSPPPEESFSSYSSRASSCSGTPSGAATPMSSRPVSSGTVGADFASTTFQQTPFAHSTRSTSLYNHFPHYTPSSSYSRNVSAAQAADTPSSPVSRPVSSGGCHTSGTSSKPLVPSSVIQSLPLPPIFSSTYDLLDLDSDEEDPDPICFQSNQYQDDLYKKSRLLRKVSDMDIDKLSSSLCSLNSILQQDLAKLIVCGQDLIVDCSQFDLEDLEYFLC